MGEPLIHLQQVVKHYAGQAGMVEALRGIDLQVDRGEFLVVTGKSGAGKTTLVNAIACLDRITAGEIWINGTPVHGLGMEKAARWRGQTIGVVFQSFALLPSLTVLQNVMLPMDFASRYSVRQRRKRAMHLLEQVGIAEHAYKLPSAVSGGQQQRVAIARAMANEPAILVADEPTGSLDSTTAGAVLNVFEGLVERGTTILLVTHDADIARRGTRAIGLFDGKITSDA
ncbi:MAG: ABC transporter ATP-binding protein [Anaerolineae bacterium]|nr:ABC transporter ATP-binding protein [Anaerolineae bacterium]